MRRSSLVIALLLFACKRERAADSVDSGEIATSTQTSAFEAPRAWRSRVSTKSPALLETVDGIAVLRLDASGFGELRERDRIFAYWMAEAAYAGDEIVYDQRGAYNLAVKELVEVVLQKAADAPPVDMSPFKTYAKKVWIGKGVYDPWTYRKHTPRLEPAKLEQLIARALDAGGELKRFGVKDRAGLKQKWPLIQRVIFDETFQPASMVKSPPEGQDIITASSNTYYEGLRLADLAGFKSKYPLNSRVVKKNGRISELVYRTGGDGVPPGLYAEQLGRVRSALRMAIEVAETPEKQALEHLDQFFRTGESEHLRAYERAWLSASSPIETVLGFVEVYGDPRGEKGELEGLVLLRDEKATKLLRELAEDAAYFEGKMPWDDRYKKTDFSLPAASAVQVLAASGRKGPVLPDGLSLPNDQSVRQQFGSKNFHLFTVVGARRSIGFERLIREFTYDPADYGDAESCSGPMWDAHLALHEVTGHGSGKVNVPDWAASLREFGSAIEEARADAVALHFLWDPRAHELGLVPEERCLEIHATNYVQRFAINLRTLPDGDEIQSDHLRAQSLIVQFALERGALQVIDSEGELFLVVNDPARWRLTLETLLGELMRIKGEGDYDAAKQLVQKYGSKVVSSWRQDVIRRLEKLALPTRFVYVPPKIEPIKNPSGQVIDARLVEGQTLEEWMLRR